MSPLQSKRKNNSKKGTFLMSYRWDISNEF